ncbi:MAG: hypothetical protein HY070_12405 [Chloroflexi bacterium]|nr:hypothetical protein [Chloroflexota bacterium]MBI3741872.1 hypothetical protein [Chloroflexota bacterium]
MPKKSKKMKQRAALRREILSGYAPVAADAASDPNDSAPASRSIFSAPRGVANFSYDYSHIYADLKRIALFAIFFFGVLIFLSFVIK